MFSSIFRVSVHSLSLYSFCMIYADKNVRKKFICMSLFDYRCYSTYPQITYWQEGFAEASII